MLGRLGPGGGGGGGEQEEASADPSGGVDRPVRRRLVVLGACRLDDVALLETEVVDDRALLSVA